MLKREEILLDRFIPFYDYNQFLYVCITTYSLDGTVYENYLMDNFKARGIKHPGYNFSGNPLVIAAAFPLQIELASKYP